MAIGGCFGHPVERYAGTTPTMSMGDYFSGPIKAWGLVQNWRGHVVRRFEVDMIGTWAGDTGTLEEQFTYYDGETQYRNWTIRAVGADRFEGRVGDIIGVAEGSLSGNVARWRYRMDLSVGNRAFRIAFDDWMFRMDENVVINRSYLKKFGITVAELTLFMQKQTP